MYCPSCANEVPVEIKYCNRCGANLSLTTMNTQIVPAAPVRLALPSIVLGLTTIFGLGIIISGASRMAVLGLPAVAIVWITLFAVATLFGSISLMIRFWTKLISLNRETSVSNEPARPPVFERPRAQQLPPRFEGVPSVTENTTRTFSPVYSDAANRGKKEY